MTPVWPAAPNRSALGVAWHRNGLDDRHPLLPEPETCHIVLLSVDGY